MIRYKYQFDKSTDEFVCLINYHGDAFHPFGRGKTKSTAKEDAIQEWNYDQEMCGGNCFIE